MQDTFSHALVAFLYALGLCLTLLHMLSLTSQWLIATAVCLGLTLLCAAASLKKWTRWALGGMVAILSLIWLLFLGGLTTLTDVLRAVTLHVSGVYSALPMFQHEAVLIFTILLTLGAYLLTNARLGGYPSLMVLLALTVILWLRDTPEGLIYLLPAIVATVAMLIHAGQSALSLGRILPLICGIVAAAYLLVPASGVTIAPLKESADTLRQRIFDYLFFTSTRNVFTLATEGYYPLGQNQLGGPASPDDDPVMMVSTPKMVYLRGSVKDQYTGRTWVDTQSGRRYLWISSRWRTQRDTAFDASLPEGALGADTGLMTVEQVSVRMMNSSASSMFLPQRVRSLQPGGDLVPYFNVSSEVFATRDLQAGDTYTVTAPLMLGGEAGLGTLVTACASTDDPNWPNVLQTYLSLPDHLQQELYDLAAEVTAQASTPYDKAYALQTYLSRTYRYTLDVEIQPTDVDFVSYFLLKSKEGYCTYFASAMTVLCRMVGLPARYVEGYLAQPEENGVAYVTGRNGHAWTEVYFEGFGWLTFDATPLLSSHASGAPETDPPEDDEIDEPQVTPPPEDQPEESVEPSPEPETSPSPEPPDSSDAQVDDPDIPHLWWLWLLLAALAATAVRIWMTQPQWMVGHAADEMIRWSIWMQAVHDCLRIMQLPRQHHESPIAYMRRLDSLRRLSADMLPLGECEALVFYGRMTPEPAETQMASAAYVRLFAGMAWYQKVHLVLLRAFVPQKHRDFTH